jgi:hypothetical protein
MSFYPVTAQNHYNTQCKERATLLPYLCDDRVYKNKNFKVVPTVQTGYYDHLGVAVEAPAGIEREFVYHPEVGGRFMLAPEVGGSYSTSVSETDYYGAVPVPLRIDRVNPLNFISKALRDGLGRANVVDYQSANLTHKEKGGDDFFGFPVIRNAAGYYETKMEDYRLVCRGKGFLDTDKRTIADAQAGYQSLTGAIFFKPTFNIRLTFGTDGFAETRAYRGGKDITDEVTVINPTFSATTGNYLRMELEEDGISFLTAVKTGANTTTVTLAGIPATTSWRRVVLFLPIRRYSFTDRTRVDYTQWLVDDNATRVANSRAKFANGTDVRNLPVRGCVSGNAMLDKFKSTVLLDRAAAQFSLLRMRQLTLAATNVVGQVPRTTVYEDVAPFTYTDISEDGGSLTPVWEYNNLTIQGMNASRYRKINYFNVLRTGTFGGYLAAIRQAAVDDFTLANKFYAFKMDHNYLWNGVAVVDKTDPVSQHAGWKLGNGNPLLAAAVARNADASVFDRGTGIFFIRAADLEVHAVFGVFFERINQMYFLDWTNRAQFPLTLATLEANIVTSNVAINVNRRDDYLANRVEKNYFHLEPLKSGVALFDELKKETHLTDGFVNLALHTDGVNNVPLAGRIHQQRHRLGYMCPFIDDFWQHEVEQKEADDTPIDIDRTYTGPEIAIRDAIDAYTQYFPGVNAAQTNFANALFIGTVFGGDYPLATIGGPYNANIPGDVNAIQHFFYDMAIFIVGILNSALIPAGNGWDVHAATLATMRQNAAGNALFAPGGPGGDDYTLFNTRANGQPWVPNPAQALADIFKDIYRRYNRPVFDLVSSLVNEPSVSIISVDPAAALLNPVRNDIRRGRLSDVTLKENLLTVGGLSHFLPDRIYKSYFNYPPLIQDFDLALGQSNLVKYREFSRDVEDCVLELTGQSEFTIRTKTGNSFNQVDKSLQTILWIVPKIVKYTKDFAIVASGRYKIPFETSKGRPTKVFVYIERVSPAGAVFDENQPCVAGLELLRLNQSIASVRELDEYEVYDATRRNSAVRCDLQALRKKTGGVLFSLEDVCDWADFDIFGARDTFKGEFLVNEADVRAVDTRIPETLETTERAAVSALGRRITVLFIYEQYCLKGQAGTMKFWDKPEMYYELQATVPPFYTKSEIY